MQTLPFTRPTIGEAEQRAVAEVLASGWITTGPKVAAFEQALADYIGGGVRVLAFNSGTSALEAALLAHDIGPGDEVIVPAMSFAATANVVLRVGARPRFVDVDLHSRNLTAASVARAITGHTRAIMPVHFAGLPVDLEPLYALARERSVLVIEDAAQALGTRYLDRPVGATGNPVCFSFHPNKNITTIEGGALAIADPGMARRLARIRFHGIEKDAEGNIEVPEWGGKMNLSDVSAAIGLVQLPRLDDFIARRRALALHYAHCLPRHGAALVPQDLPGHSWHMYCVCVDFAALGTTRPAFLSALAARGILAGIHYPAIHTFGLYRRLGYGPGDFPNAERIGAQTLTLPLFPAMELADVERVCEAMSNLLSE
ncbi:DegT/DnrJ/EryC1/StrS aminotransferase family protein [uncultured Thiodictyon sp.]|uniref:DegT/DnrJ/EryC1/StrS family aminotransferase n=1 Tax=uncultured Thiodictyon sp. TaxID=1846217 RepID=UPI0025D704EE|nr:DegT/DnrJ/EryC1/StrS aminotransferase family protein [uncultured Thiodictyon sp.]